MLSSREFGAYCCAFAQRPGPSGRDSAAEALYREFPQWRVKQLFAPE